MYVRTILAALTLACCHASLLAQARGDSKLMPDRVGPQAMPSDIAPIDAPFEMPALARPTFGQRRIVVNLSAVGASGELVTTILQSSIDHVSDEGGGTVVIPEGEWLTGRLVLKSGVNLHVSKGATLRFSGEIEHYLPAVPARYEGVDVMSAGGLIYANNAERIAVTGGGLLAGPKAGPVREVRRGLPSDVVDIRVPVAERVLDGMQGRHYLRPQFICLMNCRNVLIESVALQDSPMWNIVPIYCEGVIVRGVSIRSRGVVNGDGVNVVSSKHVLVEYCTTDTGDDCYALKAGRGQDGLRTNRGVEKVVLRFNHATGGIGGIACGSETAGGIRDVYAHDCLFEDVRHALYLKTRRPRGGGGEHLTFERIRFNASYHGVLIDMIGLPLYVGELGDRLPRRRITPLTPYYHHLTVRDLQGVCSTGDAIKIKGIPESPARELVFEDVDIESPGLPNLADVAECTFDNCVFRAEESALKLRDAANVTFRQCRFEVASGTPEIQLAEPETEAVRFIGGHPKLSRTDVQSIDGAKVTAAEFSSP